MAIAADFLSDLPGEMAALIRSFDWSHTSLGPIESWPQSLKTATGLLLLSPLPIVMLWDPDGYMIYNDGYSQFAGNRHPQLLGSKVREGWPEVADFNDNVMRVCLGGGTLSYKDRELVLNRTGTPERAWLDLAYSPVLGEDGKPAGVIAMVVETTSRVLAERRAETERDRQRQLVDQMPGFVGVLAGPEHVFEYVNDAYMEIAGHRTLLGMPVRQAFPELEGQGYFELLDKVFITGDRYVACGLPVRLREDPERKFIDLLYEPIRDEVGTVTGIFVGGYDATEAYRTSAALKELNETLEAKVEERTRELKDSMDFARLALSAVGGVGVWIHDIASDRYICDAALAKLYNIDPEIAGRGIDRAGFLSSVHPDDRARIETAQEKERLRAGDSELEYRIQQADGAVYTVLSRGHTSFNSKGEPVRRIGISIDLTRQRLLEDQFRQSQKMEAVGQLTGGIAHDFNNLLAGISGSLEVLRVLLAQGKLTQIDRYLTAAQGATRRAAGLTHRLLAFSRRQTLDPRPTDVNRLVRDMEDLVRRTVGPEISIEVVGAAGLWPTLVDSNQLENALLNLCINARDAMPNGGRITIETANKWLDERTAGERDLAPGQYISLCVTDTGTGMTPEVKARAFDPFFTTKPMGAGTGLGLSMIYGFARQSGGQVRIYTEVGLGTTMCLYLPRHHGTPQEISLPAGDIEPDVGAGEVVLVVDDEPTIRMLITDVLKSSGYLGIEAGDGATGLKILQSNTKIDLLITDVGLPGGMNGRQLADAARALRPNLQILFITGYAENAAVGNGQLEPGMELMTKPFAMEALAQRVRRMMGQHG